MIFIQQAVDSYVVPAGQDRNFPFIRTVIIGKEFISVIDWLILGQIWLEYSVSHVILLTNFILTIIFQRFDCADESYPSCFEKIVKFGQRRSAEDLDSLTSGMDKMAFKKILWKKYKGEGFMDKTAHSVGFSPPRIVRQSPIKIVLIWVSSFSNYS